MRIREATTGSGVYLLHFRVGIPVKDGQITQHYLGCSSNVRKRVTAHKNGTSGAALTMHMYKIRIGFRMAREWRTNTPKEAYLLERALKRGRNSRKLCPICSGDEAYKRGTKGVAIS